MSFEAAIRQFLESFKLPGEAQKIIRILEAWSRQFYGQEPGIFSSADAVYILAISVIMLNTDKHNPAVSAPPHTTLNSSPSGHGQVRPAVSHLYLCEILAPGSVNTRTNPLRARALWPCFLDRFSP